MKLLLQNLQNQSSVCFDTETTGLDALHAELVGISFSYEKGKGFYVPFPENQQEAKIGALGLRLKNQCCYHGLSLNVHMDLAPFEAIDPCGYVGLQVTQTKDLGIKNSPAEMGELLLQKLIENFK